MDSARLEEEDVGDSFLAFLGLFFVSPFEALLFVVLAFVADVVLAEVFRVVAFGWGAFEELSTRVDVDDACAVGCSTGGSITRCEASSFPLSEMVALGAVPRFPRGILSSVR